ncbi:MAG: hypothetical protein KDI36_19330, partial [Pseudomonadales bacterium]|nr:hypothetical protein [Pseudomonadales bacterium]
MKRPHLPFNLLSAILLLWSAMPATAAQTHADLLFTDIRTGNEILNRQISQFDAMASEGTMEQARDQVTRLLKTVAETRRGLNSRQKSRLYSNASLLIGGLVATETIGTEELPFALSLADEALQAYDDIDTFDADLITILQVRAYIHELMDEFDPAVEDLRRAQHIVHRHRGVYSETQLPLVDRLAGISIASGRLTDADREYRFQVKIAEREFGSEDSKKLPTLLKVAEYLAKRAEEMPTDMSSSAGIGFSPADFNAVRSAMFRESFELYDRAIEIVEQSAGPDDPLLVDILKSYSQASI